MRKLSIVLVFMMAGDLLLRVIPAFGAWRFCAGWIMGGTLVAILTALDRSPKKLGKGYESRKTGEGPLLPVVRH